MSSAYLLVSHGSRDLRPQVAMNQLAEIVHNKAKSDCGDTCVGIAYLELNQPLHEQIRLFTQTLIHKRLVILPLFLQPGIHVMEDIPFEIAQAEEFIGKDVIVVQPYLGSHPDLKRLLTKQIERRKDAAWIFLAHGSRRPGANTPIEAMAKSLGAVPAFWSCSPTLESRVKELVLAGCKQIAILPFFLFAGGITDATFELVEKLKLEFPGVNLDLAEPLAESTELADLIWDLLNK